jgi:hypothetical protein
MRVSIAGRAPTQVCLDPGVLTGQRIELGRDQQAWPDSQRSIGAQ